MNKGPWTWDDTLGQRALDELRWTGCDAGGEGTASSHTMHQTECRMGCTQEGGGCPSGCPLASVMSHRGGARGLKIRGTCESKWSGGGSTRAVGHDSSASEEGPSALLKAHEDGSARATGGSTKPALSGPRPVLGAASNRWRFTLSHGRDGRG